MRRIGKYLFLLCLLLVVGFVVYAVVADLPAPTGERAVVLPLPQTDK
jgi:hypothetical protein